MGSREDLILELYGPLPPVPQNSIKWKRRKAEGSSIFLPAIVVTALGGLEAGMCVAAMLFSYHCVRDWFRGRA